MGWWIGSGKKAIDGSLLDAGVQLTSEPSIGAISEFFMHFMGIIQL